MNDETRTVGAPLNNTNSKEGQHSTRALEMVLDEIAGEKITPIARQKTLMDMWRPLVEKALESPSLDVVREVTDRLDGRAKQSTEITGDATAPITVIRYVDD